MATPQQHFEASRRWQEHYQKEVEDIGLNIPPPTLGQTTNDYRREMMRLLKKTFIPPTHDLYKVNMRGLPADVLAGFEDMLLPACKTEAFNPLTVPKGEMREIVKTDANGLKVRHFIGQESFVKAIGRPGKRMAIHDQRTKEWYPISPEEWRRRNYDATRR
jgi:hypothetical protein